MRKNNELIRALFKFVYGLVRDLSELQFTNTKESFLIQTLF